MERMKILSNKKYDMLIIEIETLKEIRENDEMCINMMADRINRLEEENKKLRDYADNLDSENDNQAIEIEELKKENKKLKDELSKYKKQYQHSM